MAQRFIMMGPFSPVAVEDVVNRPSSLRLKTPMYWDAGGIEGLVAHLRHQIVACLGEDDYLVDVGTVADVFVLLHGVADAEKAPFAVHVEFGVGDDHFRRLDAVDSRSSVRRSRPLPYFSFIRPYQATA